MTTAHSWLLFNGALKAIQALPTWARQIADEQTTSSEGSAIEAYFASAWAFRAVQLKAEAIASAPLKLYDANDEEIKSHPLLDVLHNVNAEWNASDLWRVTESSVNVHGAAYWQKVKVGGRVTEIFSLNAGTVSVKADVNGISGFEQQLSGQIKHFAREDVVYFRGAYDPRSDLTGVSPLRFAVRAALGESNAEKYLAAFFQNGATPATILSTENPLSDGEIKRIAGWWERLFRGVTHQHRTGIVGGGLKPYTVGVKPSDLALGEVRAAIHQSISTALGVPELLISPAGQADLTPIEIAQKLFYHNTIAPRWRLYEEILNVELLPEWPELERAGCHLAFDYSDMPAFAADVNVEAERLAKLVAAGIIRPEAAAVELGYDITAPAPSTSTPSLPPQSEMMMMDLQRWERKSLNALRAGKPVAVEFRSDYIAAAEHERIAAALKTATTEAAVRAAFIAAPEDELARANRLLERALDKLEENKP